MKRAPRVTSASHARHARDAIEVGSCENGDIKPTILYIEDDPQIRTLLSAALEDDGYEVLQAEDGERGLEIAATTPIDLAIVDLRLPGMGGFDVVRELRRTSSVPIVIFTAHGDSHDVVVGLEAGADDFLSKPIGEKELAARLRAILRRAGNSGTGDVPRTLTVGRITLHPSTHEAFVDSHLVTFTRTEFEVMVDLAMHAPETVTRANLLERVWGYDYLGDSRLVDMQIYRIRQKLAVRAADDHLVTVRGVGFKLVGR
jgi:DNA-binding response OmpR family regulator